MISHINQNEVSYTTNQNSDKRRYPTKFIIVAIVSAFLIGIASCFGLWSTMNKNTPTSVIPTPTQTATTPSPLSSPTAQVDVCQKSYEEIITSTEGDYGECTLEEQDLSICNAIQDNPNQQSTLAIELILDSSGSMSEYIGGQEKMSVAKSVLTDFMQTIPEDVLVGLRVYGHKGSNLEQDKNLSCSSSELLYPIQSPDIESFTNAINSFEATGWTPITDSLEAAVSDFDSINDQNATKVIYLVSDGVETCDGNPIATVNKLKEEGFDVVINVVGFGVDSFARGQLEAIANISGGEYYDAKTSSELSAVFDKSINELRSESQYKLCVKREEQQFRLANVREFQQYSLCVQRIASRERLDAQALISDYTDTLTDTCIETMRDLVTSREDYIVEQSETRYDLDNIITESKIRETANTELVIN
ncbi:VWA domain-containing protein [Candidatus Dojkabacteria bacterium]|uniref:VWA domain-containing protein n=1 Tax=Candidatus Dojkabacteria bacterium TaxID=2099670 RepID=A0A955RKR3_9BACT|nr:VWA domain-containing protein [Candidatus Dojkabacteria bacterium]